MVNSNCAYDTWGYCVIASNRASTSATMSLAFTFNASISKAVDSRILRYITNSRQAWKSDKLKWWPFAIGCYSYKETIHENYKNCLELVFDRFRISVCRRLRTGQKRVTSRNWPLCQGLVLADNSYRLSLGLTDRCCAVSGYSLGAILTDATRRTRPIPDTWKQKKYHSMQSSCWNVPNVSP